MQQMHLKFSTAHSISPEAKLMLSVASSFRFNINVMEVKYILSDSEPSSEINLYEKIRKFKSKACWKETRRNLMVRMVLEIVHYLFKLTQNEWLGLRRYKMRKRDLIQDKHILRRYEILSKIWNKTWRLVNFLTNKMKLGICDRSYYKWWQLFHYWY